MFAKKFSKKSNLDDSSTSSLAFPSRTNLKLQITPKMVKRVITNLDSSNASGPDCIPVVVLRNCEPELSYKLAELFICVSRSLVFRIVERSHRSSLYLRMLGKGLLLQITALIVFKWLLKSFKLGLLIT